ncbi:glycine betaine/L-proline ABC transporter ATP-binding protein [Pseudoramibacter faecis]|uniref:quaternary amine ABC transporter ATP-binding protein n=1 Tax=Pseudoramibacter faecis TaxID=3108534 RepID=UPI002E79F7F2|nr:glycine betaine/L-proline ABC transporter ATP-binding protein [Pseudoramibacter sp. HA2172]
MRQITIKHLTKIFGKRKKQAMNMIKAHKSKTEILGKTGCTVGVYDVNLEIEQGEIFVIMGLSGSGKSTLVRMLNRLIEPTSGEIRFEDEDVVQMNDEALRDYRRSKVNMVFQNFGLFPNRTILENTEYGLAVRGVDAAQRRQRAEKILKDFHLLPFADQYPDQLSGGMQQRVGLARAIVNDPEVLLMDEAFSALDPLIRRNMQDELLELHESLNKTIVFITHDLNEALRLGDRIAFMRDGQIVQVGTGEEILMHPADEFVRQFIQDVDVSKVLTAENVMIPAITANVELDGPYVALRRMRKEHVSMLMAIDRKRKLKGTLQAKEVLLASREGKKLTEVMDPQVQKIPKETLVTDIFNLIYDSPTPLAVVDEKDRLLGVVIRGTVLEALADISSTEVSDQNTPDTVKPDKEDAHV